MSVTIHWFRYDLRLSDNPALTTAARSGKVVPVYILEDKIWKGKDQTPFGLQQSHAMGAATKLWLHYALSSLQSDLNTHEHISYLALLHSAACKLSFSCVRTTSHTCDATPCVE